MSHLEPGTVIGDRYEILSLIKAGGMGAVYQARDVRGGPLVALKEMLQSFPYEVDRNLIYKKFEEEARLLELLNHPSIPRVLAHFAKGDNYYIVMEYIDGESLEQLLDDYLTLTRRPMPPPLVVECAMLLCPILMYLHGQARPVIHRDIKPGNIILRKNRTEVVLVDFGLARDISPTQTQSPKTMVGTLGYAALEQLRGQPEIRSDLYSLGVTMHHLLSGRVPKLLELPPLDSICPDLPPELVVLVTQATQEDPALRFQSAGDMETALARLLATWKPLPRLSMARSLKTSRPSVSGRTGRMVAPVTMPRSDTAQAPTAAAFQEPPPELPVPAHPPPAPPPAAPRAWWRMLLPLGVAAVFAGGLWAGMLWGEHQDDKPVAVASVLVPSPLVSMAVPSPSPAGVASATASASMASPSVAAPVLVEASAAPFDLLEAGGRGAWRCGDGDHLGVALSAGATLLRADQELGRVVFTPVATPGPIERLSFTIKTESGSPPFLVWLGNGGVLVNREQKESPPFAWLMWHADDIPLNDSLDVLKQDEVGAAGMPGTGDPQQGDVHVSVAPGGAGVVLDVTQDGMAPIHQEMHLPGPWTPGQLGCRVLGTADKPLQIADLSATSGSVALPSESPAAAGSPAASASPALSASASPAPSR